MRDTQYATELATGTIAFDAVNEGKIERILVKEYGQDEIRFSWWKDGRMMMRPLDLTEDDLLILVGNGIQAGVFTPEFRKKLKELL
jgi:hypothetical protein